MHTKEAILYVLHSARYVTDRYLSDLSDEDLLVRPVPQGHTMAWQLGHLILSEAMMASAAKAGAAIALPAGFEARHSTAVGYDESDSGAAFCSKEEYVRLRTQQRERTLSVVEALSNDELSLPGPEKMRAYAPTKGAVLLAIGTHEMMHSGQFAVIRRVLNKSVVI